MERGHRPRTPYPLDEPEQQLLFSELGSEAAEMATFAVNTGARDQELCTLQWARERQLITADTPQGWRSVFVLPREVVKNGESRVLVLNDSAQAVLDRVRERHPRFVFVSRRGRVPVKHLRSAGWAAARGRAAQRYPECLGREAPTGFRNIRVHDLRHAYARRLRAAGVSLEDRRDLLGYRGSSRNALSFAECATDRRVVIPTATRD
ncbi:MAG: tyrosine-type recombinase/integrase [Candidatus Eiseniibacteriota bacterium]